MKALVTGCCGFIGSRLTRALIDDGTTRVVGVDCLSDYYCVSQKRANLSNLKERPEFEFIERDVCDLDLKQFVAECDWVFHLAGQPGVRGSWGQNFDVYWHNNVRATQLLLEAFLKSERLKKFVFASSSSVYGDTRSECVDEGCRTQPHSPYGVTKLAAEGLCNLYGDNFGLPTVALRFFTVFGPGQRPDMAFHRMIKAGLSDEPFTVFGDGRQERDFTYVDDIVSGLRLASTYTGSERVFNLGGGNVARLSDAISFTQELVGGPRNVVYDKRAPGDVFRTSADIAKARELLGYQPRVHLRDGLANESEWLRTQITNGR